MTTLNVVEHAFTTLASLTNDTLTNLTQTTLYLPENGKTFKSVIAYISCDDIITATGGTLTTKNFGLRLGAAAYTTVSNANTYTNSGENASWQFAVDFTSHFTTNWTGASMTCDFQLQINQSTGTTLNMVNVSVKLEIVYEHDETATTRIKTVRIPLNAPVGALTTTATTYDTIPNLSTRLGEASKVFRNIFVEVQGNEARNTAVTDHTMTIGVGAGSVTTGNYEGALASDRWFKYIYNVTGSINTGATQNFQLSDTVGRNNHLQATLIVTYEFDASTSTVVEQSLLLPVELPAEIAGGTTSADSARISVEIYVEEPGTITTRELAFYGFWTQNSSISGLNMRLGTGSFVAYTDTASVLCGCNGAMVRNDAAITLVRGKNTLTFDVYRTDTTDFAWGFCGYFVINYSSGKSSQGIDRHNKSVPFPIALQGTGAVSTVFESAAIAPNIPETNYFINHLGVIVAIMAQGTVVSGIYSLAAQVTAAEGGQAWAGVNSIAQQHDNEAGVYIQSIEFNDFFKQWPSDPRTGRLDIETARKWRLNHASASALRDITAWITYHGITFTAGGSITQSAGGSVDIECHRESDGLVLATTSRTGNGAFSTTVYDNTETLFLEAWESSTKIGRSDDFTATGSA